MIQIETRINNDTLKVYTLEDYLKKVYAMGTLEIEKFIDSDSYECELIAKIVACEVSIFLLRRSAGSKYCASVLDDMYLIRKEIISIYETRFRKWKRLNEKML
jgi:hypothetical protein